MMDMNLTMAVFVLPMILEFHGNSSVPLSEKVLAAWKQEFPKSTLQAAEYSYIEAGFHKKFCYITTAVCETFGKPDDCYELRLLRTYRDGYLAGTPGGEEMIRKYYDVAPSIVKHIQSAPRPQGDLPVHLGRVSLPVYRVDRITSAGRLPGSLRRHGTYAGRKILFILTFNGFPAFVEFQ